MNSFTDYYALLGVDVDAPRSTVKAAFKKLALKYHPDVYKGEDADERMRLLLLAYQTLNDPVKRREYDALRSEFVHDRRVNRTANAYGEQRRAKRPAAGADGSSRSEVSPDARRDRQRYYDFPPLREGQSEYIDLVDIGYTLSPNEARALVQRGMLRGVAPETEDHDYFCHRCHNRWYVAPAKGHVERWDVPHFCPKCKATDWIEYLLLRCVHCHAVFESEQIRYEIGSVSYGNRKATDIAALCPPYELFPLCPYCGASHWCPAEDARVQELRQRAEQRAAMIRMALIGAAVLVVVIVGFVALVHP